MITRSLGLLLLLAGLPATGQPLLEQPLDCVLGETCYIQKYVDVDTSDGWADYACGNLSNDGHKGTDFALHTIADMAKGVDVLAAADGVVAGTRDGMADVILTKENAASVDGRECGNGVAIDHGKGWVTQYCHLKLGSVVVSKGQHISAGTPLGQVGLSGNTQFPHLHLSVRHNGVMVDPFAPSGPDTSCTQKAEDAMWRDNPGYVAGALIRLGFETAVPKFSDIKAGSAGRTSLPPDAAAVVLFAHAYGSKADDQMILRIQGPMGFSFEHSATLEKPQALYFRAAGKKRPKGGWPKGTYKGTAVLMRDGEIYHQDTLVLTIR